jgi:hypothetical protein
MIADSEAYGASHGAADGAHQESCNEESTTSCERHGGEGGEGEMRREERTERDPERRAKVKGKTRGAGRLFQSLILAPSLRE